MLKPMTDAFQIVAQTDDFYVLNKAAGVSFHSEQGPGLVALAEQQLAPSRVWRDSLAVVEQMWLVYPLLELSHGLLGKDGKQALLALRQLRQHRSGQQRSKLPWIVLSLLLAYTLADQFD